MDDYAVARLPCEIDVMLKHFYSIEECFLECYGAITWPSNSGMGNRWVGTSAGRLSEWLSLRTGCEGSEAVIPGNGLETPTTHSVQEPPSAGMMVATA